VNLKGMTYRIDGDDAILYYPDGDYCAKVQGNLGMDITSEEIAAWICIASEKLLFCGHDRKHKTSFGGCTECDKLAKESAR